MSTPNKPVILASNKPLQAGELFMKMAFDQVKGHEMDKKKLSLPWKFFTTGTQQRGWIGLDTTQGVFHKSFSGRWWVGNQSFLKNCKPLIQLLLLFRLQMQQQLCKNIYEVSVTEVGNISNNSYSCTTVVDRLAQLIFCQFLL